LKAHDIQRELAGLSELKITPQMTEDDAMRSMRFVAPFNQCMLGVVRFSGQTPWERHPDGDELLQVLEGGVDVTLLTDDGPVHASLSAGSVFVVPRGLWHRQLARESTSLLFATPAERTENSWAEDPRQPT